MCKDIDSIASVLGVPVDQNGLGGREWDVEDPNGNPLRIAAPRPSPGSGLLQRP
jgi:hypothetical protein